MKKITWIQVASKRYGGRIYGEKVRKMLSNSFMVETIDIEAQYLQKKFIKPIEWLYKLIKIKGTRDLWVRDDFITVITSFLGKTKGKNVALIYHIDFSIFGLWLRIVCNFLNIIFLKKLEKFDAIVTISEYWRQYFLDKGYRNVYKIYPGFALKDFDITEAKVRDFKNKYNLLGKTIVYIGNCQKVKGVVEAHQALKTLNVFLVTSGHRAVDIPALHLNLDYKEYLCLLKTSSLVIVMSQFKEGWCMTAHEAMLCKTPVIGSGLGGMKELLNGGKQIICSDFTKLRETVKHLLDNPALMNSIGENGFMYAKEFTDERFRQEWLNMVNKLLGVRDSNKID